ncbi:hypothetical protein ACLM5J_11260 [Nocardioides sp. Bht2]|uniref:hypothetical protein n=1 Tax=Nocardioides sp. Bht2 TaxID=3392297 RepID=UPI0039B6A1D1
MTEAESPGAVTEFLTGLRRRGWQVEPARAESPELLSAAHEVAIPEGWRSVLERFSLLVDEDESRWFLSAADFAGSSDSAFAWNAFERLSLEAAVDDADRRRCTDFWREFLPIALGVEGSYEYLAISRVSGVVVHGAEPEFEEVTLLANDLPEFLTGVAEGSLGAGFFG